MTHVADAYKARAEHAASTPQNSAERMAALAEEAETRYQKARWALRARIDGLSQLFGRSVAEPLRHELEVMEDQHADGRSYARQSAEIRHEEKDEREVQLHRTIGACRDEVDRLRRLLTAAADAEQDRFNRARSPKGKTHPEWYTEAHTAGLLEGMPF